jgi:hypothetical protein
LVKSGVTEAKRIGATRRASVLVDLAATGARFLTSPAVERALQTAANPSVGGLISHLDLAAAHSIDCRADELTAAGKRRLEVPWSGAQSGSPAWEGHAAVAMDARGSSAAIAFGNAERGIELADLELMAPLAAVPVERGVPRTRPGTALPHWAPLAILLDADGAPVEVRAEFGGEASRPVRALKLTRTGKGEVRRGR